MSHLVEMETFLKVAAQASFSAAARDLRVSVASVTRRVSALESELGVKLLSRSTRSVSLTEAGRNYVDFAERILREIHEEESKLARRNREPKGLMRIIVSKSFGSLHIGQAAADFMAFYPDVQVSIVVSDASLNSLDPVASGFDMAIRLGDPPSSRLIARRLGSARWFACASPKYLAEHGNPEKPSDLAGHACIVHTKYFPNGLWKFTSKEYGAQTVAVTSVAITNSVMVGLQLSLKGIGVSLLPEYCVAREISRGGLCSVLPDFSLPVQTIRAVYARDPYQPQHMKRFIAFLRTRFSNADWLRVSA